MNDTQSIFEDVINNTRGIFEDVVNKVTDRLKYERPVWVASIYVDQDFTAVVVTDGMLYGIGKAQCSLKDSYDGEIGANIAISRAINDLVEENSKTN